MNEALMDHCGLVRAESYALASVIVIIQEAALNCGSKNLGGTLLLAAKFKQECCFVRV